MKTIQKILLALGAFALLLLLIWGFCETAGSDYYNYDGYVIDINEENGETVLVTLSGDTESRFTVNWYTREKYKKDTKEIEVGDRIMLTTARYSDTNIKKLLVDKGYSIEGKIFYVEELPDRPFLFTTEPAYGTHLFDLISFDEEMLHRLDTGDTVRVYYRYPFGSSIISVEINALKSISEGSAEAFSDAEKKFITDSGYKIKE